MATCAALTAVMARLMFPYDWTWIQAMLFGSVISATDPVAVVALLQSLGKKACHSHLSVY